MWYLSLTFGVLLYGPFFITFWPCYPWLALFHPPLLDRFLTEFFSHFVIYFSLVVFAQADQLEDRVGKMLGLPANAQKFLFSLFLLLGPFVLPGHRGAPVNSSLPTSPQSPCVLVPATNGRMKESQKEVSFELDFDLGLWRVGGYNW